MDSYKLCDNCSEDFNQIENKPYSIVPCGHEFCLKCIEDLNECPTCSCEIEHKIINWGLLKAIEDLSSDYDVFISYQWDIKEHVRELYKVLTTRYNIKVWMDEYEMGSSRLASELASAISKSKVFLCCITQRYSESRNCIHEINWAYNRHKKFVVLMFERLMMDDIPDVGFLIDPLVRYNVYKNPEIFENWSGPQFDSIVGAINDAIEPNRRSMIRAYSEKSEKSEEEDLVSRISVVHVKNDDEEEEETDCVNKMVRMMKMKEEEEDEQEESCENVEDVEANENDEEEEASDNEDEVEPDENDGGEVRSPKKKSTRRRIKNFFRLD